MNRMSLEHFEHPIPKLKELKAKPEQYCMMPNFRSVKIRGSAKMRRGKIPGRHH
ncbi:hypothetical protein HHO41_15430 [Bacillus sp. DNRA2]|uniref:hypothetical protein n=1 Tax=Bacillus sp. DNRA2 TaxID=2723053 RepID=UPI00145DB946|nr:hypothetical protein [Bacillus sp. DNRA2]NMD71691.1 hypothetical protein [Bacillus sp. DNRA2]